jgi:hypothetical protein
VLALWQAVYGTYPPAGTITFELSLVDPISGLVGAAVRAATSYTYTPPPAYRPLIIEIEGDAVAEVWGGAVEIEGDVVADAY